MNGKKRRRKEKNQNSRRIYNTSKNFTHGNSNIEFCKRVDFVSNFKWLESLKFYTWYTRTHNFTIYNVFESEWKRARGRDRSRENTKSIVVAFVLGIVLFSFSCSSTSTVYQFDTQQKSAYKRILKQINKPCIDRWWFLEFFFARTTHESKKKTK